ncbi:DNA (cytosine-5)-methyltransferase 3B-like [Mya arenaria]|uniref:DNA (cytosine-5)-methyltransferase 3B-like n=1 Tax=Mya arenaria TaxID=6604 RepID=UPI0022E604B4|nr:DNA (cytosine-5)-methyltransferase 3B-like [Mya arenaria]
MTTKDVPSLRKRAKVDYVATKILSFGATEKGIGKGPSKPEKVKDEKALQPDRINDSLRNNKEPVCGLQDTSKTSFSSFGIAPTNSEQGKIARTHSDLTRTAPTHSEQTVAPTQSNQTKIAPTHSKQTRTALTHLEQTFALKHSDQTKIGPNPTSQTKPRKPKGSSELKYLLQPYDPLAVKQTFQNGKFMRTRETPNDKVTTVQSLFQIGKTSKKSLSCLGHSKMFIVNIEGDGNKEQELFVAFAHEPSGSSVDCPKEKNITVEVLPENCVQAPSDSSVDCPKEKNSTVEELSENGVCGPSGCTADCPKEGNGTVEEFSENVVCGPSGCTVDCPKEGNGTVEVSLETGDEKESITDSTNDLDNTDEIAAPLDINDKTVNKFSRTDRFLDEGKEEHNFSVQGNTAEILTAKKRVEETEIGDSSSSGYGLAATVSYKENMGCNHTQGDDQEESLSLLGNEIVHVSQKSKLGDRQKDPKAYLEEGRMVWGVFGKGRWWPAVVVSGRSVGKGDRSGWVWLYWLSDRRVSQVKEYNVESFNSHMIQRLKQKGSMMHRGINRAIQLLGERSELEVPASNDLQQWALTEGLDILTSELVNTSNDFHFPEYIIEDLQKISRWLDPDGNTISVSKTETLHKSDKSVSKRDNQIVQQVAVNSLDPNLKENNLSGDVCFVCKSMCQFSYNHPLFMQKICAKCKKNLRSSLYAVDDDGCGLFCCVCGEGGQLFVCETPKCGRAFCFSCVRNYTSDAVFTEVQQTTPWPCFLCTVFSPDSHGDLEPRPDRDAEIIQFFQPGSMPVCKDLDYLTSGARRKLRVLSLFDGIGTGRLALDLLGLDVELYVASEINPDAMAVSSYHHNVTQLGDVWGINKDKLRELCPIDLVLGGPPCNDLSIVNPLRKGFNGSGILVVRFVSLLRDVEALCKGSNHVFWLMENTAHMPNQYKEMVCHIIGMEPAIWDAKHFTGQRRARCFWGNLPGMYSGAELCKQLEKERTELGDALISNFNRTANVSHTRTVTTGSNSLTITNGLDDHVVSMDGVGDEIWVQELERLFGFPTHYTDVGQLTHTRRRQLIGKAWSVPVIKHLLSPLRSYFKVKDSE